MDSSTTRRKLERSSGVLLHPTSLPGPFGTGDLGPEAHRFVDWLSSARQGAWQVLPLGPTDGEFSPYTSLSAFAVDPLLVSPEELRTSGLVGDRDVERAIVPSPPERASFSEARVKKESLLRRAFDNFETLTGSHAQRAAFDAFLFEEGWWLDDHALFLALRAANGQRPWFRWTEHVSSTFRPQRRSLDMLSKEVRYHQFVQWVLVGQWRTLRDHAHAMEVRLIGDLPIYVSGDSADVWAHRDLFRLDARGQPTEVSGVPPDYFSETGQLWGNPIYDWEASELHGHDWWICRVKALLGLVDVVRLDHFRGFQAYWSVPATDATAERGRWCRGPGESLFRALERALGIEHGRSILPFIAEDLGYITPPVRHLREEFGLPGLQVMQFIAAGFEREVPDPDAIPENSVAYTGTHDNNTALGWLEEEILPYPRRRARLERLCPADPATIAEDLIELTWRSPARLAIAPAQDVLGLGAESRMNLPGSTQASHPNWQWRLHADALGPNEAERLHAITSASGRAPIRVESLQR